MSKLSTSARTSDFTATSFKSIHKNWQEEMKFIFVVSKCGRIFYEMLNTNGYIKLSYPLPPLNELKHRACCKWPNYALMLLMTAMSYAGNSNWLLMKADCVYQRLKNLAIFVRPNQVESTSRKCDIWRSKRRQQD